MLLAKMRVHEHCDPRKRVGVILNENNYCGCYDVTC